MIVFKLTVYLALISATEMSSKMASTLSKMVIKTPDKNAIFWSKKFKISCSLFKFH